MPTLDWIGKKAVLNHHNEVPFRLLQCDNNLSVGDPGSGNLLVEGDNLVALKALLPYYAGQVKCIYIDPPYNTGNEKWSYNDAVNSPEMKEWLGKWVKDESEDLSRHDKWLCMMYPRLQLLKQFLREDGTIFISIDDNELNHLRLIMDDIFGPKSFIATIIWQKIFSAKNTAKHFSEDHDYILVYALNPDKWKPNLIQRTDEQDKRYKNPDNDPRGIWTSGDLSARNPYSLGTYQIECPSGRIIKGPPKGMYWRVSETKFQEMKKENRIWWGKEGNNVPRIKRFLSEVKKGMVPQTLWLQKQVGNTQEAKKELLSFVEFEESSSVFITPKPLRLLKYIINLSSSKDYIILDSFAGSGTTGHAVLDMNKEDGGNRRFIMVEMESSICESVTSKRLTNAIAGNSKKKSSEDTGLDGGFRYCRLGQTLFNENGNIREDIKFDELGAHVYFSETGEPIPKKASGKSPLLGIHNGTAIYLLYNGILGDKKPMGGNVLTRDVLSQLPAHDGPKVVYGTGCRLGESRLKRQNIIFRQIPYEVRVS